MPSTSDSILSPYHPANQRNRSEPRGTYTHLASIPKPVFSLGWELEANHGASRVPSGIDIISDGSVNGESIEYVCMPAVTKSPQFVLGVLKDLVHAPSLNTDKSCGYHVHVSLQGIALARLRNWALATESLAKEVEELAFNAVPDARHNNQYCRRIDETTAGTRFVASKYSNSRRYNWLNTVEIFRPGGIRTIEVRLLGNTHRWKYLLAWSTFSLMLAREGWKVAHTPFESRHDSVKILSEMLQAIITEIKPLEKKSEPVPVWVHSNLKALGIDSHAWDRPLLSVLNTEHDLNGRSKKFYSDNQATIPNRNDDDNEDGCECGCGNDGRCDYQMHSDGDCDSSECSECHEQGDCVGSPRCRYCEREHIGPFALPDNEPQTPPTVTSIEVHPSNAPEPLGGWNGALTADSMRTAVNAMRNMRVDNALLTAHQDMTLNGVGAMRVTYDESVNTIPSLPPAQWTEINGRLWTVGEEWYERFVAEVLADNDAECERQALARMTDDEMIMSTDRQGFYRQNQGGR